MADFNGIHMGSVWEAVLRLREVAGGSWPSVARFFKNIVDDPIRRLQVWRAGTGELLITEVTKTDWVERELGIFKRLAEFGIPMPSEKEVASAWFEGCTSNHRFVPHNVGRRQLLEACHKAGIKVNGNDPKTADYEGGDKLPTERGTLESDLERLMTPTDAQHRPFMLNHDQQVEWAKEQGGDGITSVEETLYLILRAWVELGRVPFMGGWIRCRNRYGSDDSLRVRWSAGSGLGVDDGSLENDGWYYGAFSRKFRPSAV